MRTIFISIMILLLLTACGVAEPAPTSTVTAIITPTATFTATPTFSPTVTFTPTPAIPVEIIQSVETTLPGYTLRGDQLMDTDGNIVPELKILVGEDGVSYTFLRKYEFLGDPEFSVKIGQSEIKVMEDGGLDTSGWLYKDDGWTRETKQFPGIVDGKVVNDGPTFDLYSAEEVTAELALTAETARPEEKVDTTNGEAYNIAYILLDELLGRKFYSSKPTLTYGGMLMQPYSRYFWGDNALEVQDELTGEVREINTAVYVVDAIGENGDVALVGWRAGGEDFVRVVDKPGLNDLKNFNSLFEKREPKW